MVSIQQPPILRGTDGEKITRLHSYLYQIARDLNSALNNLTEENFVQGSVAAQVLSRGPEQQKKELDGSLNTLKSLIIKTSDTVQKEVDALETELHSSYVAQSELGTFLEEIDADITARADALEQEITSNTVLINAASQEITKIDTRNYIRQGIVGYTDDAVPIIGIAIGQDIQVAGTENGYDIIDTRSNMSIWTPEKLSFFINGAEAGYFSNGALYTGDTIVKGKLFLSNNRWEVSHTNGFTIKWIGG